MVDSASTSDEGITVNTVLKGTLEITYGSEDDVYTASFRQLNLNITTGGASVEYSSENSYYGEDGLRLIQYALLVNHPFSFRLGSDGTAGITGGYDELRTKVIETMLPFGGAAALQAAGQLDELINESTLCYIFTATAGGTPEEAAVNDVLGHRSFYGMAPYSMSVDGEWTLTAADGASAEITVEGSLVRKESRSPGQSPAGEGNVTEAPLYDLEGTESGTVKIRYDENGTEAGRTCALSCESRGSASMTAEDGSLIVHQVMISRNLSLTSASAEAAAR